MNISQDKLQIFHRFFNEYAEEMEIVEEFEHKLRYSLSLNRLEKMRLIEEYANLSQVQLEMLMQVFDEEEAKFEELVVKDPSGIELLKTKTQKEWKSIVDEFQ